MHQLVSELHEAIRVAPYGLKFVLPDEVAGWCPTELGFVLGRLLESGKRRYMEVGTFCGRSLIYALRSNKNTQALVVDPLVDSMIVGTEPAIKHWERNIRAYDISAQVNFQRQDIARFYDYAYHKSIDIAFVDGNHDSGHTLEALRRVKDYLSDEAIVIIDDYEIYGGHAQTPFPGYPVDIHAPVKTDAHKFLAETPEATIVSQTPWLHSQLYLFFNRRR